MIFTILTIAIIVYYCVVQPPWVQVAYYITDFIYDNISPIIMAAGTIVLNHCSAEEIIHHKPIDLINPSELYRPEHRDERQFRNFENSPYHDRVEKTYRDMHTYQTVDLNKRKINYWGNFDHVELTILEALESLNTLVDPSDPDIDLPNSLHGFQTAERIRAAHPDKEWFQLTGLIHDIGKVMALFGEPQWAVVGDTFPVGCAPDDCVVFGRKSFEQNADFKHQTYSTKLGVYEEGCGLDKVSMSWGHDEYLYRVLTNNENCALPMEGLYVIRYHSFYPWHSSGAYRYLSDDYDRLMLQWVKEFNKFDLYSKTEVKPDLDAILPYYERLIEKYLPGKIKF